MRQTGAVNAATVQGFTRFARYWDCFANSGRFRRTLGRLLDRTDEVVHGANSPFHAFLDFADWIWRRSGQTSGFTPEALVDALFDYLTITRAQPEAAVRTALLADYVDSGARGAPSALKGHLPRRALPANAAHLLAQRQERHLAGRQTPD